MIHFEQLILSSGFEGILDEIKESIHYGPDVEKLRDLWTSLQVIVLQSKMLNRRLIVANTHLYYHPDGFQIRMLQVYVITRFLSDLQRRFQLVIIVSLAFKTQFVFSFLNVVLKTLNSLALLWQKESYWHFLNQWKAFISLFCLGIRLVFDAK